MTNGKADDRNIVPSKTPSSQTTLPVHTENPTPQVLPKPGPTSDPAISQRLLSSQVDAAPVTVGKEYPDQPLPQCAVGNHERTRTYGVWGLLTAIACFPCGLICLFADRHYKCARCGVRLDED